MNCLQLGGMNPSWTQALAGGQAVREKKETIGNQTDDNDYFDYYFVLICNSFALFVLGFFLHMTVCI